MILFNNQSCILVTHWIPHARIPCLKKIVQRSKYYMYNLNQKKVKVWIQMNVVQVTLRKKKWCGEEPKCSVLFYMIFEQPLKTWSMWTLALSRVSLFCSFKHLGLQFWLRPRRGSIQSVYELPEFQPDYSGTMKIETSACFLRLTMNHNLNDAVVEWSLSSKLQVVGLEGNNVFE